jgi:hypothetical protein
MVKIRYSELPAGLHVAAATDPEGTIVYLQPGLTSAQRRAALTRVRSSARIGQGPTLPGPAMARAIAADRVRTNARIGAAAARRHPILFLPPLVLLLVSAVAFMFASIQPLTAAPAGSVGAAVPTLRMGAQLQTAPSRAQPYRHPRTQRAAASSPAYPGRVHSTVPPSCAAPQPSSSRQPWPMRPTRAGYPNFTRCLSHPQRWARTHRL